jgi:hypothetical protein
MQGQYAISKLEPNHPIPYWVSQGEFYAMVRTDEELSLVCNQKFVPKGIQSEKGWQVFKVLGPLDFSMTGVLAGLTSVLAKAGISIFAISTYNTDYLLLKQTHVNTALQAFTIAGYDIWADSKG